MWGRISRNTVTRLLWRFASIFYFICEFSLSMQYNRTTNKFRGLWNIFLWIFKTWWKPNFDEGKFLKFISPINLPWGSCQVPHKIRARFDVYWIQTDRNLTDKQSIFIDNKFQRSSTFNSYSSEKSRIRLIQYTKDKMFSSFWQKF